MISKEQREKIKKMVGREYAFQVAEILKEYGVKSRNGTAYSLSMIRNVYNGINENMAIESAIFELYMRKKKVKNEIEHARNKILGISQESSEL